MASVGVEWINNFPDPCRQNPLSYCDEVAEGFLNGMVSRGHTGKFNWGNQNAFETDFRETTLGGNDSNWVDTVDFALFSSHGGTNGNVFQGCFGRPETKCTWRSDEARYGNNFNLEYLILDTCKSLELSGNIVSVWQNTFQRLRMIFGFTGNASDASWTSGRGEAFGRRAGNNERLTDAWLDESYSFWADDNPVTLAAGRSRSDAINRRDNERLNSGFGDIPNNEITFFAWRWRS
jgi:hypothetical protein